MISKEMEGGFCRILLIAPFLEILFLISYNVRNLHTSKVPLYLLNNILICPLSTEGEGGGDI